MKLPITLEIMGATQDDLKALSTKLPQAGKLSMKPFKDSLLFWKLKGFEIVGVEVPDQVNRKADYWPLSETDRKDLASLFQAFRRICPRIFTIYSSPGGELPRRDSEVQLQELLDMIGDLSLLGHPILGHVIAEHAGHAMHTALVLKLMKDRSTWTLVTADEAAETFETSAPAELTASAAGAD